ncbi:MAG: FIST N-terminal domain-containing protein [Sulfuricellaceae bacterium]|nr:FIST N-terminal domain-containing protein [Sulfuricellaceae bacterium]
MRKESMMRYLPTVEHAAIDEVLASWQALYPALGVYALLPEAEKQGVAVLQAVCARREIPLVGGIFPDLVKDGEFCSGGVWLLCFAEMPYYSLRENLPTDTVGAERAAENIAAEIRLELKHTLDVTLFMLFDAMVPNISTLLDNIYLHLANRVHYAGGNAGSESFQPMPCLFDGQRVVQNGVLLMLLKPHHGAIVEHGYHAPERTVYATSTHGNRISQIDWRPAFEVYQELVRAQYGVEITAENFYQHAVHFPFGIIRANHHVVVRIPVMLAEDGSLFCVGEVPANAMLALLETPSVDTNETLRVLMDGLISLDGEPAGSELLLLYCAGRRMHLGMEAATVELQEFAARTQAAQIAGALSLGEIGGSTVHGYPLFHNATLVASCWHKKSA